MLIKDIYYKMGSEGLFSTCHIHFPLGFELLVQIKISP